MKKVKVKILNSIVGANFSYSAGQEVEMEEAQYNAIKAHCELLSKPKATKKKPNNVREL